MQTEPVSPESLPITRLSDLSPLAWSAMPLAERVARTPFEERAQVIWEELAVLAPGEVLDLAGADLRGVDLRPRRPGRGRNHAGPFVQPGQVVLDGANLVDATLSGANLAGVSLRRARLDGALMVGVDLHGADLSGASLHGTNLSGANLARADLSFTRLHGASLLTADLTDATLTGADLRETVLHAATLVRATLRATDLRWAHLDGANLSGAVLDGAQFEAASLILANLTGAHLSASTNLSFAFLHQVRLDRSNLRRTHLAGGVGEACTDLVLAQATYRTLKRHFLASGHGVDARWAHCKAQRMATAAHRPDRARQFHVDPTPTDPEDTASDLRASFAHPLAGLDLAAFTLHHGAAWCFGHLLSLTTGYGTSFARLTGTLLAVWLLFALYFQQAGAIINVNGVATGLSDALRYSAAALTPMDAYPVIATAESARLMATLEGVMGMALLGALGYVAAARLGRD